MPVMLLGAFLLVFARAAFGAPEDGQPSIQDLKFNVPKVRQGDTIQYSFVYKNFIGGLAAVKDVEMWIHWQRPGDRPVRSRFVPNREELAKHTAESGSFDSRPLKWRAPEAAPVWGVDVEYTLKFTLKDGRGVEANAMIRFE